VKGEEAIRAVESFARDRVVDFGAQARGIEPQPVRAAARGGRNHHSAGLAPVSSPQSLKLKYRPVGPLVCSMKSPLFRNPGARARSKSAPSALSSMAIRATLKVVP
jgi:hypothetical protein